MSKPREFWIDDWGDAYPSIVELWKKTKHGSIIHVIEYSAYESLKAQNQINRMAAENGTKRIAELEAENEKLKEAISYLPKVPTQPYEKELAQKCVVLEAENEKLKEQNQNLNVMLETLRAADTSDLVGPLQSRVYTLAKQNEELKSRSAKLVEALKSIKCDTKELGTAEECIDALSDWQAWKEK